MALDYYQSADLFDVIYDPNFDALYPAAETWWVDQFFPRVYNSNTGTIYFDEVDPMDRRLAPFVAPNVQGVVMRDRGFTTKTFAPAYVKPKHIVEPSRTLTRRPGEPFLGNLSQIERYNRIIEQNLADERDMIRRRWNWMAASAIINGSVVVAGERYPTTTVDFGRDSTLTTTLTGGATWDNSGADILGSLAVAKTASYSLARGPITKLIFGLTAWTYFQANAAVQKLLSNQSRFGTSNFSITSLTNNQNGSPAQLQGQISVDGGATLQLWTYSDFYENYDGTMGQYLDPTYVVGVGEAIQGVQCFGAIQDVKSLQPVDIFPKTYQSEDPSATYVMSQSAPLMVPTRPNNTFRMKVSA